MNAQDFARAMLDKSLGFLLKQCQVTGGILIVLEKKNFISNPFQDYVPSRADCPGYDIPLEKTPRQMDSGLDSDNYYPSGERRPANGELNHNLLANKTKYLRLRLSDGV